MKLGDSMNPEQYALEILNGIETVEGNLPEDGNEVEEALSLAIEALEKQIPKKPIKRSFIVPYEGINVCPSCKKPLPSSKEHHCKCGQKLDWSDTDD